MSSSANETSRLEREFWDRQFDQPPVHDRRREAGGDPPASARPRVARFEPDPPWRRVLEWLRDRRGDPRIGVVVLVLVAVAAGFVWYRIGVGGDDAGAAAPAPRAASGTRLGSGGDGDTAGSDDAASTTTESADGEGATNGDGGRATDGDDGPMLVHVAGAVARPGVVELTGRARVIDAVEAVGGATAEGDLDRLNLAAPVTDGARVFVPVRGQADPGVLATGGPTPADGTDAASAPSPGAKLDLNTATQAQLEALPGIGPAYAQAIIAERERRGGFSSVNELREVRGIGDRRFADLAPLVTV